MSVVDKPTSVLFPSHQKYVTVRGWVGKTIAVMFTSLFLMTTKGARSWTCSTGPKKKNKNYFFWIITFLCFFFPHQFNWGQTNQTTTFILFAIFLIVNFISLCHGGSWVSLEVLATWQESWILYSKSGYLLLIQNTFKYWSSNQEPYASQSSPQRTELPLRL